MLKHWNDIAWKGFRYSILRPNSWIESSDKVFYVGVEKE